MPVERLQDLFDRYCLNPDQIDTDAFADVSLDDTALLSNMQYHSELYLKWSRLCVIADSHFKTIKYEVEKILWAEARQAAHQKLVAAGDPKPSKDRVDDVATIDPEYRKHVEMMHRAERIYETFKRIEFAMLHRRDMISEMNSRQNRELRHLYNGNSSSMMQDSGDQSPRTGFREMEAGVRNMIQQGKGG